MEFHYAPGVTSIDPDEAAGLVPTHITTQGDPLIGLPTPDVTAGESEVSKSN